MHEFSYRSCGPSASFRKDARDFHAGAVVLPMQEFPYKDCGPAAPYRQDAGVLLQGLWLFSFGGLTGGKDTEFYVQALWSLSSVRPVKHAKSVGGVYIFKKPMPNRWEVGP